MKVITEEELNKYDDNEYIWYACYGSNINYKRFMYYINGDAEGKYSTSNGCQDKTPPVESRKFLLDCPIYFAGKSNRWGGGMAFLDYEGVGKSYGKIYKIKMSQYKGILNQEHKCTLYDTRILIDYIDSIPVFTFTAENKLVNELNEPSNKYVEVIKNGLKDLDYGLTDEELNSYLSNNG